MVKCKRSPSTLPSSASELDWPERDAPFEIVYHLFSYSRNDRLRLKVDVAAGEAVPTLAGLWKSAEWNERARVEYESAMLRHLYADAIGEAMDPDSGFAHKAHAAASAMIMEWHDRRAARAEVE